MGASLLLAVVLGAGVIPIPESASRFPDSTGFVGWGPEREANMVAAAVHDSGQALQSTGPGPQQLAARWVAGSLNAAERVVVLLGGGTFHDPAMLPVYEEAIQSNDPRVRKAAAIGLFTLIGAAPPLPSQIPDQGDPWQGAIEMVRTLETAARTRPLVRIWVTSYLAGKGVRRPEAFAFLRSGEECLQAIQEIAEPEDLPDVLALWPLLDTEQERISIVGLIESITLQRLVDRPPDPSKPWGARQFEFAAQMVDAWVAGQCQPVDGWAQVRLALRRHEILAPREEIKAATWFRVLAFRYAPFMPLALDQLGKLGGCAVDIDRERPENPVNQTSMQRLMHRFPISADFVPREPRGTRQVRPRVAPKIRPRPR